MSAVQIPEELTVWVCYVTLALISVPTSDVLTSDLMLRGISDVWCFGDKSDVDRTVIFVFHISCHFRWKEIRFIIIFKFRFSVFHPHLCLVIIPNRNWVRCIENNIYVTHDRLLHFAVFALFRIQYYNEVHRAFFGIEWTHLAYMKL